MGESGTVKEQMCYRLSAAVSASCRPRCRLIRVCATCEAPFPCPRACVGPLGPRDGAGSSARGSTVHGVDLVRVYRVPFLISIDESDTFDLSSATLIDIIVISGLAPPSIQTLAFQHLFRLSRWSSDDELREHEHCHGHLCLKTMGTYSRCTRFD